MNVQWIIDRARSLWYVSQAQYSNAKALEDFNTIYKLICSTIMQQINEYYFSDEIVGDYFNDRNEYLLKDDVNGINVNKVNSVWVKYSNDGDFVKAIKKDKSEMKEDHDYYNETTSEIAPFYYIYDDSVFIYPKPAEYVVWGLKLDASLTPIDLTIEWVESDILLSVEYHYLIAEWMLQYIYQRRGLLNEKNNAKAEFDNSMTDLILLLSDRNSGTTTITPENIDYYWIN